MKKLFRLMAIAIVAVAFAACGSSNTPETVAKKYMKSYQNSDWKTMASVMDLNEQDQAEFVQLCEAKGDAMAKETGGVKSYEIKEVKIADDGNSAKVIYDLEYGNGRKDENGKINLVLIDGKWKVKFSF
jgi:hypothetical protein